MAKIARNLKSFSIESQLDRVVTEGKNGRILAEAGSEKWKLEAKKETEKTYKNLLDNIGQVLRNPGAHGLGGTSGGAKTVGLTLSEGEVMNVKTRSWAPLKLSYIKRGRSHGLESTQFWNKSKGAVPRDVGLGNRSVSLALAYRMAVAGKGAIQVRSGRLKERRTGEGSIYEQRVRLELRRLPTPLDTIIVKSFVSGKLHDPVKTGDNYARNGIGVIAYPEHFRPLISKISVKYSGMAIKGLKEVMGKGRKR